MLNVVDIEGKYIKIIFGHIDMFHDLFQLFVHQLPDLLLPFDLAGFRRTDSLPKRFDLEASVFYHLPYLTMFATQLDLMDYGNGSPPLQCFFAAIHDIYNVVRAKE